MRHIIAKDHEIERDCCFVCGGDGTIEVYPAGYGHFDDLAEYESCDNCGGVGYISREYGIRIEGETA